MLTKSQRAFLERFADTPRPADPRQADDKVSPERVLQKFEQLLMRVQAMPPRGARLLQPFTDPLVNAVSKARGLIDQGDPETAETILDREQDTARALDREFDAAILYLEEEKKFQVRLRQTLAQKNTGGDIAIPDYLVRMKTDEKRRQAAIARGDIGQALVVCEGQDHRHSAMMQEASRGADFTRLRSELETEIARIESLAPGGGQARPILKDVREMMDDAESFTKSDNWVGAVIMLRKARTELRVATKGLELMSRLPAVEKDDDFDEVYTRVFAMVDGLRKMSAARQFMAELSECIKMLRNARATLPDQAGALALLESARQSIETVTREVLDDGKYTSAFRQVAVQAKELQRINEDNCVKPELKKVHAALTEADQAARARDFLAAFGYLETAEGAIKIGNTAAHAYLEFVAPARKEFATMTIDRDKAKTLLTELDRAFRARDLDLAKKLAEEAHVLAENAPAG